MQIIKVERRFKEQLALRIHFTLTGIHAHNMKDGGDKKQHCIDPLQ